LAMTHEPRRIDRAEAEPPPASTRSVSPVSSRTWSGSTPSHSLITWPKLVSWPWPADIVPSNSSTTPDGVAAAQTCDRARSMAAEPRTRPAREEPAGVATSRG
jgi:hypothetical protein